MLERVINESRRYSAYILPVLPVLFMPVAFFVAQYAAMHPDWAEAYIETLNRFIASPVSLALGHLPFSLSEVLLVLLGADLFIKLIVHAARRNWLRLIAAPLAAASILYAMFTAGWGIAYSRRPYADAAGFDVQPVTIEELEMLCVSVIEQANVLREGAAEDGQGVYVADGDKKQLLSRVQSAYESASHELPWLDGQYGNPKPVFMSVPLSYLNIAGIFSPFTFEANVNMNNLGFAIPFTACHEAAHLRGWAREDEANYIAYSICMNSGDPDFKYSGALFGVIYAMNALSEANSERFWRLQAMYSDGLRRDLAAHNQHWAQYEGKAADIQEQVNDAYLRVNRQEDGVRSYGRMIDLMVAAMRAAE